MPLIRPGVRRLFSLVTRRERTRPSDIDEEIALHLELRAQQLQSHGMTAELARAEAARRFGHTEITRGQLRAAAQRRDRVMNLREMLESLAQDVRYAARGLAREPWFTAFVAITLGLGIGVNAAMYGVVDRLLLRGPEYLKDPTRLQNVYETTTATGQAGDTSNYFGYVAYTTLRDNARMMDVATFKFTKESVLFGRGESAQQWNVAEASPDLFPLLGVTPLIGRFFDAAEDGASPPHLSVVLGYNVWKREFHGDVNVVGTTITLSEKSYTVIGVARRGFTGPELGRVDVWLPATTRSDGSPNWRTTWNWAGLHIIARLKPGVTSGQAATEATTIYRAAYAGMSEAGRTATLLLAPIAYSASAKERPETSISRWLIGVCLVVLIVACSNVANLLLARVVRRRREVAVRLALGVSRTRLLRLYLVESLLLAGIGTLASLFVAFLTGTFVRQVLPPDIDWPQALLGNRVLLVSLAIALIVGVVIGLLPAWRASRPDLTASLKAGIREGGGSQSRLRATLTIAQAALSVVLLVGAGLFVRSLSNVRAIDLGIETRQVLTVSPRWAPMPSGVDKELRTRESARRESMYPQLMERLLQLPEVSHAALTVGLPFNAVASYSIRVPGWDSVPRSLIPSISYITDDYFNVTGARMLRGRAFSALDRKGTEAVAIISQAMASTFWPGKDAVGMCLYARTDSTAPCSRIVGVVTDAHRFELEEEPSRHVYIPWAQYSAPGASIIVARPRGSEAAAIKAIRKIAQQIDPTLSYVRVRSLQESIDPMLRPWKLGANIFVLMGLLALCVAAIGLYSVMSYLVTQRRQELGIRLALGASGQDILRLVLANGVGTAAMGVTIGVGAALAGGRFIEPLLFKTSAHDVGVFTTVVLSLLAVSLLASLVPALRARRVNPIEALRSE